ncbi:hypothetical protein BDN72DRAFT_68309 [Pluteus cervinus]|uniref:Uncharacterized protein n=1 Tax=Pluteus cervinus TaxID=181527 RepID=A0ACD3AQY7_9AGAR|nr:hypothetical protein BDN72DRAFT_68309 [Pluteus cervinus]
MIINQVSHLSNLQLVISNNEMLEEALKRSNSRYVGWRRWSSREGEDSEKQRSSEERPQHNEHQTVLTGWLALFQLLYKQPEHHVFSFNPFSHSIVQVPFCEFTFKLKAGSSFHDTYFAAGRCRPSGLQHGLASLFRLSLQSEKLSMEVEELIAQ